MMAEGAAGNATTPAGNMLASGENIFRPNARSEDVAMDPAMVSVATNVDVNFGNADNSMPHLNMQPFLAINYIIALQGIFPSRS